MPRKESTVFERRSIIFRNQALQAPLRHEPTTRQIPKVLDYAAAP